MQKSYLKLCGHKIWKNMALGSTDEFIRKNQSEADLHQTCLISRALYRFELWLVYFKCYARNHSVQIDNNSDDRVERLTFFLI